MFFVSGKRHGCGERVAREQDDVIRKRARELRRIAALDRFMTSREQLLLIVDGCHVPDVRPPADDADDENQLQSSG